MTDRDILIEVTQALKKEGSKYRILNPKHERHFIYDSTRTIIMYGSRGSAKSHSVVQKIQMQMEDPKHYFRGLVARKTFKALKGSCFQLFMDIAEAENRKQDYKFNLSELTITHKKTGHQCYFKGLDDPEKIKGVANPSFVWFEEPNTDGVTKADFIRVQTSMRGGNPKYRQTVLTFNSDDDDNWIKSTFFPEGLGWEVKLPDEFLIPAKAENTKIIHTTYKDNIFIDPDSVNAYEALKEIDEDMHKVYALGLFGGKTKGKILDNYTEIENYDNIPADFLFYGIDWGYNDPTTLVECKLYDGQLYFKQLYYRSGVNIKESFIPFLEDNIKDYSAPIYADTSHKEYNENLIQLGFHLPKIKKDIIYGIGKMKMLKEFFVCSSSVDGLKELRGWKWIHDAKADRFLDKPVPGFDHFIDPVLTLLTLFDTL
jgi:phage terminase large subunit